MLSHPMHQKTKILAFRFTVLQSVCRLYLAHLATSIKDGIIIKEYGCHITNNLFQYFEASKFWPVDLSLDVNL